MVYTVEKYEGFPVVAIRVPAQWGRGLSKKKKRCYLLGHLGAPTTVYGLWTYYRVCPGQKMGARCAFICEWTQRLRKKKKITIELSWIRYRELPLAIRERIEGIRGLKGLL